MGASLGQKLAEVDFVQEVSSPSHESAMLFHPLTTASLQNAPERPDIKTKLLAEIDAGTRPDVVIASSSSGIPSSQFISQCTHPDRILIGHPFNPPHLMPLVEVVPHARTSKTAIEEARSFYESIGRRPIVVNQETPGFVANRLQAALVNEAYSLVSRGILSAEDLGMTISQSLTHVLSLSKANRSSPSRCGRHNLSRPTLGHRWTLHGERYGRRRRIGWFPPSARAPWSGFAEVVG